MLALTLALALHAAPPPGKKLDWKDFSEIAGVTRADTRQTIVKKWGEPDVDRGRIVGWKDGVLVDFRPDGSTQLDFTAEGTKAFRAEKKSAPLELVDTPCDAAAKRLVFLKGGKLEGSKTCKHYDAAGYSMDVTFVCAGGKVSSLSIVWTPMPELKATKSLPPDEC